MVNLRYLIFIFIIVSNACRINPVSKNNDLRISLEAPQDTVKLFAEDIISTRYNERDMAISAAGDEIFYSLGNYNQSLRAIVHLRKKDNTWRSPEIMSWSGTNNDIEPCLSPDGHSLYFSSNRPIFGDSLRKDFNVWVSSRAGDMWEEPVPLDSTINSRADEYYPSLGKSGNLYFTAAHPGNYGKEDIYLSMFSNGKYYTPVPLDSSVNSATYEFNAYVSPQEDTIIFSSYGRQDDMGGGDLYISTKNKLEKWEKARNLGPKINSTSLDYCPFIDFPRKVFYFTSNRGHIPQGRLKNVLDLKNEADQILNGLDNIYQVKLSSLQ